MEQYLKRYFWVAILLAIGASAGLVAKTTNTFVGAWIEPAPLLGLDSGKASYTAAQLVTMDMEKLGHLFGIEPPPPAPPGTEPVTGDPGVPLGPDGLPLAKRDTSVNYNLPPVKTDLKLQLLAAMVANMKEYSSALILDGEVAASRRYVVGERIQKTAEVYDIVRISEHEDHVIIVNSETHRLEFIDDTMGGGKGPTLGGTLANIGTSEVPPPVSNSEGIKKNSANSYTITREKLDSTLADMNQLATQARIVPSFENGKSNGFKLFSIAPDSIYSAIGIQNGDVIQSVNGLDIDSPEKALSAWTQLSGASNFDIKLSRKGQSVTQSYGIQ